jgi:hypothetical protein
MVRLFLWQPGVFIKTDSGRKIRKASSSQSIILATISFISNGPEVPLSPTPMLLKL